PAGVAQHTGHRFRALRYVHVLERNPALLVVATRRTRVWARILAENGDHASMVPGESRKLGVGNWELGVFVKPSPASSRAPFSILHSPIPADRPTTAAPSVDRRASSRAN